MACSLILVENASWLTHQSTGEICITLELVVDLPGSQNIDYKNACTRYHICEDEVGGGGGVTAPR